jgi:hypothetical protein
VGAYCVRVFARAQASLSPSGASLEVDLEVLHLLEVEQDPPVGGAVTGVAVAAASYGDLKPTLSGERDDVRDVGSVRNPDDERRVAVD